MTPQEGTYWEPGMENEPAIEHGTGTEPEAAAEHELGTKSELGAEPGLGTEPAGAESAACHEPGECKLVSETLARIGDKWTVLVVELLCAGRGPMRFNEIRRAIGGISQRMLTLTLRSLERDGLVTRTVHPTIPPRVDYALTALGHTLRTPLV